MYVCMYVSVSDKLEQSAHAVKMSDYIGTRILEVCKCPESVADRLNGFGRVLRGINRAKHFKNWIGTNYWKSASLHKVSQADALALRDSQEFKTVLNSIGTGILEVCECPESVTDRCNG